MSDLTAPGLERNTAPVYKMPWGTIHPTTISAPIVGMAYGAYDAHVEHQGKRVRAAYAGEKAKDDPFAKVRIAEASSDIDAAWRQLSGQRRRRIRTARRGRGSAVRAAAAGTPRPGARHGPRHRLHRQALRELRGHRARQRHADPAFLARRARRPRARGQRSRARLRHVRHSRIRSARSPTRWSRRARDDYRRGPHVRVHLEVRAGPARPEAALPRGRASATTPRSCCCTAADRALRRGRTSPGTSRFSPRSSTCSPSTSRATGRRTSRPSTRSTSCTARPR